jgi:hypothetical protein
MFEIACKRLANAHRNSIAQEFRRKEEKKRAAERTEIHKQREKVTRKLRRAE